MTEIVLVNPGIQFEVNRLMSGSKDKDVKHRIGNFLTWMHQVNGVMLNPDLVAYRDYLLARGLNAASVKAHLSTIRGRYQAIMEDNALRDALYALTMPEDSPSDRKAFVDEVLQRLQNAVAPAKSKVEIITEQDVADEKHLRLTVEQSNSLLEAPLNDHHNTPLQAIRDTAMVALMLCTGIREAELCALDIADLRQKLGGALALQIRKGKGSKARLVPYGALDGCLAYVDKWMLLGGITEGAVFRGFYNGGRRIRASRLTVRAVQDVLNRYPIAVNGVLTCVNPHDLRRTYARLSYDAGVAPVAIQQNLGHGDLRTTLGYIGSLDPDQRKPPRIFTLPHLSRLNSL